jgi:hypothetical protein
MHQTALPLDEFVATDVSLHVRFDSSLIVLDDLDALVAFTKDLLAAIQDEVLSLTGEDVEFLPEVALTTGSLVIKLKLKASQWSADLQLKVSEVFLGAVLVAFPSAAGQPPKPVAVQPSDQCIAMVSAAVEKANKTWQHFGKGFESGLDVSCGSAKATYTVKNPPRKS